MPNKLIVVEPECVITHQGVKVYRSYMQDNIDHPEVFHFTLRQKETDSESLHVFDVRELDVPAVQKLNTSEPPAVDLHAAHRLGLTLEQYQQTPAYLLLASRWQNWLDVTRPRLIRLALRQAIEAGILVRYQ